VESDNGFEKSPTVVTVQAGIHEASGIAASKTIAGHLWVEEDGGSPAQLHLIDIAGKIVKQVFIKNAGNSDWEDIVIAGNEVFIADIGDNDKTKNHYTIYRFTEPGLSTDTVNATAISFVYPNGAHDADAFLVDPITRNIYIITKTDAVSEVYKLSYPYSSGINEVQPVGKFSYNNVVSACISPSRGEVLIKTYGSIFSYKLSDNESIEDALKRSYLILPYRVEPQGEAICFAADNSGYYTINEKALSGSVQLSFYKRK
jgi:hypothetical protein